MTPPKLLSMVVLSCSVILLSACQRSEERPQPKAERSAVSVPETPAFAAMGLTEMQLLNADVYGRDKVKLGKIEQLRKEPDGKVTGLIVEVEDSNPDRYVLLPLDGLVTIGQGNNINLRADMTKANFLALTDVELPPLSFRTNS